MSIQRILAADRSRMTIVALSRTEPAANISDSESLNYYGANLTILDDPFEFKAKSNLYPAISEYT